MSLKELIDTRYALPGYSLVLMIVGLIFPYTYEYISQIGETSATLLFGVIFILGTAPLGYFFSQIWYVYLYARPMSAKKEYIKILLKNKSNLKKKYYLIVLDSILYQSKQEKLKDYIGKRWALYNMIGSSLICTISGVVLGVFFRLCLTNWIIGSILLSEIAIILFSSIMSLLFLYGMRNINIQYDEMLTIIVNEYLKEKPSCLDTFPTYYFDMADEEELIEDAEESDSENIHSSKNKDNSEEKTNLSKGIKFLEEVVVVSLYGNWFINFIDNLSFNISEVATKIDQIWIMAEGFGVMTLLISLCFYFLKRRQRSTSLWFVHFFALMLVQYIELLYDKSINPLQRITFFFVGVIFWALIQWVDDARQKFKLDI